MAAPNLVGVTNILGKTAVQEVTTTATAIVTNASSSGKVLKINSLIVSNIDGTNAADVTVDVFRSSTAYRVASTIAVPADASLVVISKETGVYLEEGDALRLQASATGDLHALCSYEEVS